MSTRPPLRLAGLHLLVLWSFAVAQPLFDLLGKNGEFFAARGSTRWDAIVFALVLLLVPPLVLLALEALVPALHPVFVGGLLALFVLQTIRNVGAPGWLLVAIAAAVGAAGAVLYMREAPARLALTVLGPAPLLFLALFLFNSDVTQLSLGAEDAQAAGKAPRAPVVLVVFDELPLNSLLDAKGRVDGQRFPSFARLARGSTWFEHTSTVAEGTTHAVPAILTGRFPRAGEFPVYTDHRQNLFTLLGGATQLHVVDQETHLCPPSLCPDTEDSVGTRAKTLAEDTGVVYLHELLPDDLTKGIPSIANGWDDFLQDASGHRDPGRIDPAFMRSLGPQPRPSLWYVHVMLPHSPWTYLPSGERYGIRAAPGWDADEEWNANQAAVDQYWQRHLLQLGYADTVLGRVVAKLRATGLYDRALLVVTADHGVSFRAGEKRRPLSDANAQDIAWVPLFVKLPRQQHGRVVAAPARTIDILPTIAAGVHVSVPWPVDGRSLAPSGKTPERDVVIVKDKGRRHTWPVRRLDALRRQALRRQLALFGSDQPTSTLFAVGPDRALLGHPFEGGRRVTDLDPVDRSGPLLQVSGRVQGARSVVVVSRGRVVAVTPVAQGRFWALVPLTSLQNGDFRVYAPKR